VVAVVAADAAAADAGDPTPSTQENDMKPANYILAAAVIGALAALPSPDARSQASAPPAAAKPAPAKAAAKQRTFATAEEASKALATAVRGGKVDELLAVVGPTAASWLSSGDAVADRNDWGRFLAAYDKKNKLEKSGDDKTILNVGDDDWPFPAPIVKRDGQWSFDANAGREELLNRRVGRNELDTIQTLLAIVDAQREYAAADADGNGYADYARRFRSTPGKKDGLYWPAEASKAASPLGPLVAEAAKEGYGKQPPPEAGKPAAYHGYLYRILTSQGKDAAGGAYDYVVKGKLLGGFAVVAWPASYGSSGITTFLVNHDGVVYEKDLGDKTPGIAGTMTRFNPDATWRKAK
jgi:hypothetical protein